MDRSGRVPHALSSLAPEDRRRISVWVLYDWANSAFTTVVVTFVYSTWYTQNLAPDEVTGTTYWSRAVSLSAILIALLSPILGALADRGGSRRRLLRVSTMVCVLLTAALAFVGPSMPHAGLLALTIFVLANLGFEIAGVFYNAYLPEIAPPGRIGSVSGIGWGVGYLAGIVSLVVVLFGFVGLPQVQPWINLQHDQGFNVRAVNLLVAAWFLVFSLPTLLLLEESSPASGASKPSDAWAELGRTFRRLGRHPDMARFLAARLLYNDGLVTIFAFGGIYAAGTFGMGYSEIIVFGIVLNVVAGLGAFLFGFVDDRLGGRTTVLLSLAALTTACALAVWAPNRTWFWIAGILVGLSAGPNQASSRSLMGRFVPRRQLAEFFGFFAFSGKLTSFAGPLLLGWAASHFGSQRAGIATAVLFFVLGGLILTKVDERRGIEAAQRE